MSFCGEYEHDYAARVQYRRLHPRKSPPRAREPRPWRLLASIYKANARHEKTLRNKLMVELALETGAIWYLEQVGAV